MTSGFAKIVRREATQDIVPVAGRIEVKSCSQTSNGLRQPRAKDDACNALPKHLTLWSVRECGVGRDAKKSRTNQNSDVGPVLAPIEETQESLNVMIATEVHPRRSGVCMQIT